MTVHLVDVRHYTHTCPAHPAPHLVETRRIVVETTPGGRCEKPVTARCGDAAAVLDCHRLLPADRQCPACATTITVRRETTVHLGPYGPAARHAPGGNAASPCTRCARPLAAVLADRGYHVLCPPPRRPTR
jgi:hypothetical protein